MENSPKNCFLKRNEEETKRNLLQQRDFQKFYRDEIEERNNQNRYIMNSIENYYQVQIDLLKEKVTEKKIKTELEK